jgi:Amiloride-sensitive sodium channel
MLSKLWAWSHDSTSRHIHTWSHIAFESNKKFSYYTYKHCDKSYSMTFCFVKQISIIGLRHVIQSSSSLFRRYIWILLILSGTAFTVYQIYDRISYYRSRPTIFDVSVDYVDSMRFPTTTICNENRVTKSASLFYGQGTRPAHLETYTDNVWLLNQFDN